MANLAVLAKRLFAPSDFEISNPAFRQELASREVFTQLVLSSYSARGPPLS
jgi:hypothetical protein